MPENSNYNGLISTEVGVLPEEWEAVRLGDACNQRNEIIQPSGKGDHKFVGLEHINPGEIRIRSYQLDTYIKSSKFRFYRGDILYGKLRPYLDKAVIADFDGICSTDLLVLTIIDNKALSEYLIYLIHSNQFIQNSISTTTGTNHPRTSWKAISKFKFGLPPLPEQRRIAEVLGTLDSAIEKVGSAIEQTEQLKRGLMQKLLTEGIGHEEWDIHELGDIFSLEYGKGLTEQQREGGPYPVYGSNGEVGRHSQYLIKAPGIIVGRKGTIGAITWSDKNFWPIDTTYYIKLKNTNTDLLWLFYELSSLNLSKLNMATGTPGLNRDIAYKVKIPLPPLPEQRRIAEILSTVDKKLKLEHRRKEKLERIKKGLMNDLLIGKKRIKVE